MVHFDDNESPKALCCIVYRCEADIKSDNYVIQ
jgi:hypothetical protein